MHARIFKNGVTVNYKQGGAEIGYTAPGPGNHYGKLVELECGHFAQRPQKIKDKLVKSVRCQWCTSEWRAGRLKIEEPAEKPKQADSQMVEVLAILRGMSNRLTALEDAATKPPPPVLNGVHHLSVPAET